MLPSARRLALRRLGPTGDDPSRHTPTRSPEFLLGRKLGFREIYRYHYRCRL